MDKVQKSEQILLESKSREVSFLLRVFSANRRNFFPSPWCENSNCTLQVHVPS